MDNPKASRYYRSRPVLMLSPNSVLGSSVVMYLILEDHFGAVLVDKSMVGSIGSGVGYQQRGIRVSVRQFRQFHMGDRSWVRSGVSTSVRAECEKQSTFPGNDLHNRGKPCGIVCFLDDLPASPGSSRHHRRVLDWEDRAHAG